MSQRVDGNKESKNKVRHHGAFRPIAQKREVVCIELGYVVINEPSGHVSSHEETVKKKDPFVASPLKNQLKYITTNREHCSNFYKGLDLVVFIF